MLKIDEFQNPENLVQGKGIIDTSHIYLSLKEKYNKNGQMPLGVDFRSLLPWVKLGDQFTHIIHPYPAKLIPHIAYLFVNASVLLKKNEIVLDPFSGSGTVALEASLAGAIPHVADANPLALLISKVKTYNYNIDELTLSLMNISVNAKKFRTAPEIDIVNSSIWYSIEVKRKLEILLRAIKLVEHAEIQEFFQICFSATAKKFSYADPAISVPVRIKCKPTFNELRNESILKKLHWIHTASVIDEFVSISLSNIERIRSANLKNNKRKAASVISDNVNNLSSYYELNERPSLLITSPPYGSAQKYIRSSSISLNWLGFAGPKNLTDLESISIGREHAPKFRKVDYACTLPEKFSVFLEKIKTINFVRYEITKTFLLEMKKALQEISKSIKEGGHVVIITGNNNVCGEILENDLFTIECLQDFGLKLEMHLFDEIKSRGLMTKRNKTAAIISKESVMVFSKGNYHESD